MRVLRDGTSRCSPPPPPRCAALLASAPDGARRRRAHRARGGAAGRAGWARPLRRAPLPGPHAERPGSLPVSRQSVVAISDENRDRRAPGSCRARAARARPGASSRATMPTPLQPSRGGGRAHGLEALARARSSPRAGRRPGAAARAGAASVHRVLRGGGTGTRGAHERGRGAARRASSHSGCFRVDEAVGATDRRARSGCARPTCARRRLGGTARTRATAFARRRAAHPVAQACRGTSARLDGAACIRTLASPRYTRA